VRAGDVSRDVRYAARVLRATPGFTAVAVLTLALGVGATSAIFSVVYGVLLRPLPYRDAARLVLVRREQVMNGLHLPRPERFFLPADITTWQRGLRSLESTALYALENEALSRGSGSELVSSAVVSASFFSTVDGPIAEGRPLGPADDLAKVIVISERLRHRLFGPEGDVVGRAVTLSSRVYTIVGVAGPAFQLPSPHTDVWIPAGLARSLDRRCCDFQMIGRLNPAATAVQAAEEAAALAATPTSSSGAPTDLRATVVGLRDQIVASVRPALLILFASASLVLFAACANVTNLIFARHAARWRDTAVRRALGASSGRLLGQRLAESGLLALAGTVIGIAMAQAVVLAMTRLGPAELPRLSAVHVDAPVLLFSMALAAVATLFTAALPALPSVEVAGALKAGGAYTTTLAAGGRRIRRALCVTELAVSLVLLVAAGLLGRSLVRLMHTDLGVATDHVVTASMNLTFDHRPTDAQTRERIARVLERVQALPGVEVAGVTTSVPPNTSRMMLSLRREGDTVEYAASAVIATPGFFHALRLRLVTGRLFTADDDLNRPAVMIMSVDTAKRFFGNGNPIGRTMSLPVLRDGKTTGAAMTLVGVVADVHYSGVASAPDDQVYRPFAQQSWVAPFLVARTTGDPERLLPAIRRAIGTVDPAIVVSDVRTLDSMLSDATAQPRLRTLLLAAIAGMALLIAAVGVAGVMAQSVSQRTREIGIRMALGAQARDVGGMMLREGLSLAAAGVVCGVPAAWLASRLLRGLLYGVAPTDTTSFALACAGLVVVTAAAVYLPARRAARIDPLIALRSE
jgi:putative ABC transport system permease protein